MISHTEGESQSTADASPRLSLQANEDRAASSSLDDLHSTDTSRSTHSLKSEIKRAESAPTPMAGSETTAAMMMTTMRMAFRPTLKP